MSNFNKLKQSIAAIPFTVSMYRTAKRILYFPRFIKDYATYGRQSKHSARFPIVCKNLQPRLLDRTATTGFEYHYTYHPAWAMRIIKETKPSHHVDISSTLYFCSMVSAFVPTDFYDFRPAALHLEGLTCKQGDLNNLPFADNSLESLSCMHVVEHIGLGRYGDPIDIDGDKKAAKELSRVLAPGGSFIFVVPIGRERLEFNAHRIYAYKSVLELFPDLTLKEFSVIPDAYLENGLIRNADPSIVAHQEWACGCFHFSK